jgi:hypothetical protein
MLPNLDPELHRPAFGPMGVLGKGEEHGNPGLSIPNVLDAFVAKLAIGGADCLGRQIVVDGLVGPGSVEGN